MNFEIANSKIPGVYTLIQQNHIDERGSFNKIYDKDFFDIYLSGEIIKQINRSITSEAGSVRGFHYQIPPYVETKIVACTRGKILDVALDLRKDSPTFMKFHSEILDDMNFKSLVIPPGVAHAFQTLTPNTELLYLHTNYYNPSYEGIVNALDPLVGFPWPTEITIRSERDQNAPFLNNGFSGVAYK